MIGNWSLPKFTWTDLNPIGRLFSRGAVTEAVANSSTVTHVAGQSADQSSTITSAYHAPMESAMQAQSTASTSDSAASQTISTNRKRPASPLLAVAAAGRKRIKTPPPRVQLPPNSEIPTAKVPFTPTAVESALGRRAFPETDFGRPSAWEYQKMLDPDVPHQPKYIVQLRDPYQARNIRVPIKDALYIVPNVVFDHAYRTVNTFRTDVHGRPVRTTGIVKGTGSNFRGEYDWHIGNQKGRAPDDVGFHIGANRFGFPGGALNVVPGDRYLNLNQYAEYESRIADLSQRVFQRSKLATEAGRKVVVGEFSAYYDDRGGAFPPSPRPSFFRITYWLAHPAAPHTPVGPGPFQNTIIGSKIFRNEQITTITRVPRPLSAPIGTTSPVQGSSANVAEASAELKRR